MGVCQSNAYKLSGQAKSHDNYGSDGTKEKSRQSGAILGLSSISGKLLTCSDDKTVAVSLWNYPSPLHTSPKREGVSILTGHTKAVNRVTAFKDINGNLKCWTASRDLSLKCWDLESLKCARTIDNAHSLNISAIDISKDVSNVYSGSRDCSVKIWDNEKGICKSEFSAPRNIVTSLKCTEARSSQLFQGSEDLCVRVWDTKSGSKQPCMHISAFVYFPVCLDIQSGGNYLATGCKGFDSVGCNVKLWDLRKSAAPVQELTGHTHDVTGVRFSHDNRYLVSVSKDGSVSVWGNCHQANDTNGNGNYNRISFVNGTGKYFTDLCIFEDEAYDASGPKGILTVVASGFDGSLSYYDLRKFHNSNDNRIEKEISKTTSKKKKNGIDDNFECEDLELPFLHSTATFDVENNAN